MSQKKYLIFESLFIGVWFYILYLKFVDTAFPSIFTDRDIYRAQDLLSGHWIWHGPELSVSGYTTGPFYYYLLALPSLGGFSFFLHFMLFLFSLACGLLWYYLNKTSGIWVTLIVFLLLASTELIFITLGLAWNPSFTFIFWVGLSILLHQMFLKKQNFEKFWILFCLLIGLAAQIHISSFIWFPVALLFLWNKKIEFKKIRAGAIAVFSLQIPYFIWKLTHPQLDLGGHSPGSLLSYLEIPTITPRVARSLLGPVFLLLVLWLVGFYNRNKIKPNFQMHFKFIALLLVFLSFGIRPHSAPVHYLLPFFFCLCAYIVFIFADFGLENQKPIFVRQILDSKKRLILIAPLLGIVVSGFMFIYRSKVPKMGFPHEQARSISQFIYDKSGWDLSEFKKNTTFLNIWPETSLNLIYQEVSESGLLSHKLETLSGFIISPKKPHYSTEHLFSLRKIWFENGDLKVLQQQDIGDFIVTAFENNNLSLPRNLQNLGEPYPRPEINFKKLLEKSSFETFSAQLIPHKGIDLGLYFNKESGELTLYSSALARYFTAGPQLYLKKPQLRYRCDEKVRTLSMLDMGFSPDLSVASNFDYFLTPITYSGINCGQFVPLDLSAQTLSLKEWGLSHVLELQDFEYEF